MEARDVAVGLSGARIAAGVASLLAPGVVGRAMMGPDGGSGGTRLLLRVVGVRDLALGIGVLAALERDAPVRDWLRASALVDCLDAAGSLLPAQVRSLDAIHLATAQLLGEDLDQVITYDDRMAEAAATNGLRVVQPGR